MSRAGLKGKRLRDGVMEVFQLLRNNGSISFSALKSMEEELGKPLLTSVVWMQHNGLVDVLKEGNTHTARLIE